MAEPHKNKVYFFSDAHLGIPDFESSLIREKKIVRFLDKIKKNAKEIYIMGDLFDFWFEYKTVIPKGFVRLFGKLVELTDMGITIYFFRGNHDIWTFEYLEKEIGLRVHRKPLKKEIFGKRFYLAHGDGLGSGDRGYKLIKWIFERKINQWLFRWLHPDLGLGMGLFWSRRSRYANEIREEREKEEHEDLQVKQSRLPQYAQNLLEKGEKIDYFVMGHWHITRMIKLSANSRFVFLGDWISRFSYGVFDGEVFELKVFKD